MDCPRWITATVEMAARIAGIARQVPPPEQVSKTVREAWGKILVAVREEVQGALPTEAEVREAERATEEFFTRTLERLGVHELGAQREQLRRLLDLKIADALRGGRVQVHTILEQIDARLRSLRPDGVPAAVFQAWLTAIKSEMQNPDLRAKVRARFESAFHEQIRLLSPDAQMELLTLICASNLRVLGEFSDGAWGDIASVLQLKNEWTYFYGTIRKHALTRLAEINTPASWALVAEALDGPGYSTPPGESDIFEHATALFVDGGLTDAKLNGLLPVADKVGAQEARFLLARLRTQN